MKKSIFGLELEKNVYKVINFSGKGKATKAEATKAEVNIINYDLRRNHMTQASFGKENNISQPTINNALKTYRLIFLQSLVFHITTLYSEINGLYDKGCLTISKEETIDKMITEIMVSSINSYFADAIEANKITKDSIALFILNIAKNESGDNFCEDYTFSILRQISFKLLNM